MPQIRKAECSFVSRTPIAQVHNIWSTKLPLFSTISPDIISSVDLLQGRWGKQGCVIAWNFYSEGKVAVEKDIIEVIDKKKYRIVYKVLEGGPLDYYKSFTWIFQASPKDNVVRWTLEYEKNSEDDAEPTVYLDMLMSMMKDTDVHLNGP